MYYRYDLQAVPGVSVDHGKRKTGEKLASRTIKIRRPCVRRLCGAVDGSIQFVRKSESCLWIPLAIPLVCGASLFNSIVRKPDWTRGHYSPTMRLRASGHGVVGSPASSAEMRRRISLAHCASASTSTLVSRLSINDAASAARALEGSCKASTKR